MSSPIAAIFRSTVRPAQLGFRRLASLAVDRRLGVVTTDERVARELGRDVAHYRRTWRALGWSGVFRLLHRVKAKPDDVLLDIGCGAGRVVCAAARRPFKAVIGLEIDPAFAHLARRNLSSLRKSRCPAHIALVDARTYDVPDDVTVVFLYNPFQGAILDDVVDRIVESHDRSPRLLRIVYANPVEAGRLAGTGRLEQIDRLRLSWRPGRQWARSQEIVTFRVLAAAV